MMDNECEKFVEKIKKDFDGVVAELRKELDDVPPVVAFSKLISKIWDVLTANGDRETAARKMEKIMAEVQDSPAPLAVARLVNHYLLLKGATLFRGVRNAENSLKEGDA